MNPHGLNPHGKIPRGMNPHGGMPMHGQGSGFIVSPDGYVLTNAHVIDEAREVTVKLTDRREFTAKVVGIDKRSDVAVLKIDALNLPVVKLGNPDQLKPGEWVIAIGSPFGFENSVTAGIVSATSRAMPDDNYTPFIQTDVAVNPGNSGGPLFNLNGEVIGINSQIYSRTGGYMGLSFAVPIDIARNVEQQLVATGRVTRGRVGVGIQEVDAQLAASFGLDRPHGALVGNVEPGSPGDKAGLRPGDVVLKVDGREIETSSQMPSLVAAIKPGTKVPLQVWRDRAARDVTVVIGELPDPGMKTASTAPDSATSPTGKFGLSVRPLNAEEQAEAKTEGLLVQNVDGPAADAGIQPGDIILGINGTRIKSIREFKAAAGKAGTVAALLVQRGEQQIFMPVRVG
jgi:serine protease Do